MFDIGFTEMALIGVVALVVIGPERLPGVARTAGKYMGRLKRFMTSVKADVEQELRADELRQILADQQKELDTLKHTISDAGREIEKETSVVNDVVESATAEPPEKSPAPAEQADAPTAEAATADASTADASTADAATAEAATTESGEPGSKSVS